MKSGRNTKEVFFLMPKGEKSFKDLTGKVFGRLTAKSIYGNGKEGTQWLCLCSCGNEKVVISKVLNRGATLSCGCYKVDKVISDNTTHGMNKTRLHKIWGRMKDRCLNPRSQDFKYYGGRGIKVCEKWLKFEGFYEDMFPTHDDKLSIDRIDNDGNYELSNCRWATLTQQRNNMRNNRVETVDGITDTVANLCRIFGVSTGIVRNRLRIGYTIEQSLKCKSTPGKKLVI
jgi:hypothetical protein